MKFAKKLLGENEVKAVLQRLERLTEEEDNMTATQTLGIVHKLFQNVKVVMEGKATRSSFKLSVVLNVLPLDSKVSADGVREIERELSHNLQILNQEHFGR